MYCMCIIHTKCMDSNGTLFLLHTSTVHVYIIELYIYIILCMCMPLSLLIVGLRGYVEVTNDLNVPANFQWHAREGVDTTVFYMVHPNGTYVQTSYTYNM